MKTKRFLAILLAAAICLSGVNPMEARAEAPPYLKSVTYFSDAWPINFWNTESPNMDAELQQIVEDGFNSIILVIPWREFQPNVDRYTEYNDYAMEKLNRVMQAAQAHGLWVSARIGYIWDYYNLEENVLKRYENLLSSDSTKRAWEHYAQTLYREMASYDNFYGGFITWEDFWNFLQSAFSTTNKQERIKKAKSCGYTEFVKARYSLSELETMYGGSFRSYVEVYLPGKDQVAAKLFYDFYNDFLNKLLADTQLLFPGLSMEVRLDQDELYNELGEKYYYNHAETYACEGAAYTGAMISVAMGQQNMGERVTAAVGIAQLDSYLSHVRRLNQDKRFYFEQFLYTDNTPEFGHNAQILQEQLPSYIAGMGPVLRKHGVGYGIWVYRDYGNYQIYNPQFAIGMKGWSEEGGVKVQERNGTPMAVLNGGAKLKQTLQGDMRGRKTEEAEIRFRASADAPCDLYVFASGRKESVRIEEDRIYEVIVSDITMNDISFQGNGTIYLDDIQVYNFVQEGRVYNMDNQPLDCIEAFRQLNRQ